MAQLKVWYLGIGTHDVAVAATSKKAAVEALNATRLNWSVYSFNQYCMEQRADHDIFKMAAAEPGAVFERPNDIHNAPWTIREKR